MDSHLATLLSFPPHPPHPQPLSDQQYHDGITNMLDALKKMKPSTFTQSTGSGEHILDVINPALNSAAYAFALASNIEASSTLQGEALFKKMTNFLGVFDPRQTRYAGKQYSVIVETVAAFARRSQQTELALIPISNAILRLDPAASTLTSTHVLLSELALESQIPSLAFPVLEQQILFFPISPNQAKGPSLSSINLAPHHFLTPETGLTEKLRYQQVLQYFLLTGTAFITSQHWEQALEALECAIVYPVKDNAISKIMVEAYKKWILVHVLVTGKAGKLPSITATNVGKSLHILAKPYEAVAALFATSSALRLKEEVEFGNNVWVNDGNMGLMYLILSSFQKFQICNLANLYRTIPISEVTRLTTSAETGKPLPNDQATEDLVRDLIARGMLQATLTKSSEFSAMITFNSSRPILSEQDVQVQLGESMSRLKAMIEDVRATDRCLTYDKEYLKWASKQRKLDGGPSELNEVEDMGWGDVGMDGDEDLMANS